MIWHQDNDSPKPVSLQQIFLKPPTHETDVSKFFCTFCRVWDICIWVQWKFTATSSRATASLTAAGCWRSQTSVSRTFTTAIRRHWRLAPKVVISCVISRPCQSALLLDHVKSPIRPIFRYASSSLWNQLSKLISWTTSWPLSFSPSISHVPVQRHFSFRMWKYF